MVNASQKRGNLDLYQYPKELRVLSIVVWYLREPINLYAAAACTLAGHH